MMYALLMPLFAFLAAAPLPPSQSIVLPMQPLVVGHNSTDDDGFCIDKVSWSDGYASRRSAALVHNDVQDPMGFWGGYVRTYTLRTPQGLRQCTGSLKSQPGFGYTVNHFPGDVNSSRNAKGDSWRWVLQGPYHAILEQSWTYPLGDYNVKATVQWLFATGRSHPLYAVTFDSSGAPPNGIRADSRAPYGDIGWDGDAGSNVDGVAWGDRYVFRTLGKPVTVDTGWDYTKPNTVPYTLAWSESADAEMGLVQTQTEDQHDAGGYAGYKLWGTRSRQGPMPDPATWPYQINQWELPYTSTSKRMAWGLNYGAVGQTCYSSLGNDRVLSGYPYQSYSTFVVIGAHSRQEVKGQVRQIEAVQRATFKAISGGHTNTSGPGGVGRHDDVAWDKPGCNPIYASFEATFDGGQQPLALHIALDGNQALNDTLVVVHNWDDPKPELTLNGKKLVLGVGAAVSFDAPSRTLWLSLFEPVQPGVTSLTLTPACLGQKAQG